MAAPTSPVVFTVTRHEPELITPAKPTPHEYKQLSDIESQQAFRFQVPFIHLYRNDPSMRGRDHVKVIREALAQTLVYYYPLAGRLREGIGGKLIVDCTGEGIMFIEADADVKLDQFGHALQPPFPCFDDLLYDVPGSQGILHCPLLLIQVTRLACGGFIFALRLNHTMCDAAGLIQFLTAVAEMARGATAPSVLPVWQRELLNATDPPRITFPHPEYDQVADTTTTIPLHHMANRNFFFGPAEISALRRLAPPHLQSSSRIELLTAWLWRSRVIALQLDPNQEVIVLSNVNGRRRFNNPPLPAGYYGNAFTFSPALTTAGKLCGNPLGYALELVRKAIKEMTQEYMKSVVALLAIRGRSTQPSLTVVRTYLVSDLTHAGFEEVDFGWGNAAYAGPAMGGIFKDNPGVANFYIPFRNDRGENGIMVPICLPASAMERFEEEFDRMLKECDHSHSSTTSIFIKSNLLIN